jgi:23S rRNA maturation mini-RNase III
MRTIAALTLFWIGDMIAKIFLRHEFTAQTMYKPYHKIMILSSEIDNKQKVWEEINNHDEI